MSRIFFRLSGTWDNVLIVGNMQAVILCRLIGTRFVALGEFRYFFFSLSFFFLSVKYLPLTSIVTWHLTTMRDPRNKPELSWPGADCVR